MRITVLSDIPIPWFPQVVISIYSIIPFPSYLQMLMDYEILLLITVLSRYSMSFTNPLMIILF